MTKLRNSHTKRQKLIFADDDYSSSIGQLEPVLPPASTGRLFDIGNLILQCLSFKLLKHTIFIAGIVSLSLFSFDTAQATNWFDLTWNPNHKIGEDSKAITIMSNNSGTKSTIPDVVTARYVQYVHTDFGDRYIIKVNENGKDTAKTHTFHGNGFDYPRDDGWGYLDVDEDVDTRHECNGERYTGYLHNGTYGHWILHFPDRVYYGAEVNPAGIHFCPNKEFIAKNLAVGDSATLRLHVQQQGQYSTFLFGSYWANVNETEEITLTIKRVGPEIRIEPIVAGIDKAFADSENQKAFANSEDQVNLIMNHVSDDPVTVQYQISTSGLFDTDVIDRTIVMGGSDQLVYPLDILDSTLLSSGNYRRRISIRVLDVDGEVGPNDYRISGNANRNKLTMEIIHGAVPTLSIEAESVYSDDLFGSHGHFLGYFTIISEPARTDGLAVTVYNKSEDATIRGGSDLTFAPNSSTLRYRANSTVRNYDVIELEVAEDAVNTPKRYIVGTPSSAVIYKSLPTRPGITLSITEDSVRGGESFTVKAETTHPVTAIDGLKVLVSVSDVGSRIEGTVPGEIKIDKDSSEGSIIVSTNRNTRGEEDTISFSATDSLSYVVNPVVGSDSVQVRAPTLTITDPPATVAESDGTLDFNFTLDVPVNRDVTVAASVASGSTVVAEDYTLPSSPLTISSGSSSLEGSISIQLTNDSIYEGDETIVVEFTSTNAVFSGNVRTHRLLVTITDEDDKPEISFKSTSLTVDEGGSIDLTLVSTFESASPYSIGYTLTNATGNFLEIPAGDTESNRSVDSSFTLDSTSQMLEQALSITTRTANELDEGNGEITIVLDTPEGTDPYTIDDAAKTVTVTMTNVGTTPLPTITVTESSSSVAETTGATLTYTFTLSSSITEDVSIAFAVSPDSTAAVDGTAVDYTLGSTSPLVISGGNTAVSLVVTAAHDTVYEGDETIILDFTSSNAVFSTNEFTHRLTGTITDDDSKPEISFKTAAVSINEGESFALTLEASIASEEPYSIGYTLTNSTGNFLEIPVGSTESNRMVESNFVNSAGNLEQSLSVATRTANQLDEVDGQITVVLDTPDDTAPYTIDDMAKTVTVSVTDAGGTAIPTITVTEPSGPVTEAQGATLTYTFELSGAISEDVSIAYAVSSDSTAESGDYTLGTASPLIISADDTTVSLTITIEDEPVYEGDETIIIALASNNAVFSAGVYTRTVTSTIADDDPKPTVSFKSATQNAVEGVSFDLTLVSTGPTESPYSIGYTLTNTTGDFLDIASGNSQSRSVESDFASPDDITRSGEQTLSIDLRTANNQPDSEGVITVVLDDPANSAPYSIDNTKKTVTVTVVDESEHPTITVTAPTSTDVAENAGTLTYTFTLSEASSGNETITPSLSTDSNNTAEVEDYTLSTITFTGTTATLDITIDDDSVYEGDETLILDLTAANAIFNGSGFTQSLTVGITDNETKPEISFKSATQNAIEGMPFNVTLVASVATEATYTIGYTLTNTTGDFIEVQDGGTVEVGSADSDFTRDDTSQLLEQVVFIATRAANGNPNGQADDPGEVAVALSTPADTAPYTIHATKNTVTVTVSDELAQPIITVSEPNNTIAEAAEGTLTYTFTLSSAASGNASITHSISNDTTAEANDDYVLSPVSFTGTTGTMTIKIEDDSFYEGDERIIVDLTATNAVFSGGGNRHRLTVTITDDETKPVISFKSAAQNAIEGTPFTVTMVASGTTESSYPIGYTLTNTTGNFLDIAGGGTELNLRVNSSFTSQMLEQELTVATRAANGVEDNPGEISVSLDAPSSSAPYTVDNTKRTVAVSVADESTFPTITVKAPSSTSVDESTGTLTYGFELSSAANRNVSITHSVKSGSTAEANTDFTLSDIAFTGTTASLDIGIVDDSVHEGDETIIIELTAANGEFSAGVNTHELTVTITDAGDKPVISFKSATQNAVEGHSFSLTLAATNRSKSPYSIGYTLTNTTGDFLDIPNNQTELQQSVESDFETAGTSQVLEQTFSIDTRAANSEEDDPGAISVVLDTPEGTAPYKIDDAKKTVSVTVTDPSSLPTITVTEPSSTVAAENVGTLTYRFELTGTTGGNESITAGHSNDSTAEETADYSLSSIVFTGTTATLTVTIEDDSVYEGDETLVLDLTAANAVISGGGFEHKLTLTITDNEAKPTVSFQTASHTIAEGASVDLTLVASGPTESPYSVGYTLTNASGNFLELASGATELKQSVDANFQRNAATQVLEQELTVATRTANGNKDDNGEISVVLDTPPAAAPYVVDEATKTASVSVVDDSIYVIAINPANRSVTEGQDIVIELESTPVPKADFDVELRVSANGASLFSPVSSAVSFKQNNATVELRLTTMRNPSTTESGEVTVAVVEAAGYMAGNPALVHVTKPAPGSETDMYSVVSSVITEILQQLPPTPPQGTGLAAKPTLTISASRGTVAEGESAVFAISASFAVDSDISIRIKLNQSGDFVSGSMDRSVVLTKDSLEAELVVKTDDDQLAELDGRITATIQNGSGYLVGSENTAHVAVSDALDAQHRKNQVSNAMQAVLPNLLAHSTTGTLGIASERVEQAFSGGSATSIELNGKSSAAAMLRSGGRMLNDSDADWRSIIDGSSFTVALFPEGGETRSATVWGVGDKWGLSSDGTGGSQSWDAETHTGHFGFDARVGRGLLTGLAMSVSNADIDYGRDENPRLSLDARATGVHPYLGFVSPDGNSSMQILAGYGVNEMDLKQEEYSPEILNGQFHAVGLSGSNRLYSNDNIGELRNLELSVVGEAWHAQQSVNSVAGVIDSLNARASHFRIAIEESNNHYLDGGGTISPSISIGLQGDVRNQESLTGLNVSSQNRFEAFNGLEIEGSGRFMLSGLNRVRGWEIGSSLDYDYGNDEKGILLYMEPSWSGTDTNIEMNIWGSELADVSIDSSAFSEGGSFSGEIGFGLEVLDGAGIATPFYEFKQSGTDGSEFRVGSRFATSTGIRVELGLARDIPATGAIGHSYNLNGSVNW